MEQVNQDTAFDDSFAQPPRRRGRPRTRGVTTQMNVRVDKDLKVRGDEVLRSMGSNPTDIISRLWGYVVRTGQVPDFLTDPELEEIEREKERLNRAIDDVRGMPWRVLEVESVLSEGRDRSLSMDDVRDICAGEEARRSREVV